jgi:hypothetical protein
MMGLGNVFFTAKARRTQRKKKWIVLTMDLSSQSEQDQVVELLNFFANLCVLRAFAVKPLVC